MSDKRLYVRIRGKILGPFDLKQLQLQRDRGQLGRFHEISENRVSWKPASTVPELFPVETEPRATPKEGVELIAAVTPASLARPGRPESSSGTAPPPQSVLWHYLDARGTQTGPVTRDQLLDLLADGALSLGTLVWSASQASWLPLREAVPLPRHLARMEGGMVRGGSSLPLISLILSCTWLAGLGSLAGVVLGALALRRDPRGQPVVRGRALAVAGLVVGICGLVLTVAGGVVLVLVYHISWTHTPEEIASEHRDRVYLIKTPEGSKGSGIMVANNKARGLIATNLHVIDAKLEENRTLRRFVAQNIIPKEVTVEVQNPSQLNSKKAHLAAFHRDFDLALLIMELENASPHAVAIIRKRALRDGEGAVALGNPLGLQFFTSSGVISSTSSEKGYVWTTCSISSGNSGGPLFIQRDGLLAGLNTASLEGLMDVGVDTKGKVVAGSRVSTQNLNGAVPAEEIVLSLQEGRSDSWVWVPSLKDMVIDLARTVPVKE
jgi:S1-C subfamily serine protease